MSIYGGNHWYPKILFMLSLNTRETRRFFNSGWWSFLKNLWTTPHLGKNGDYLTTAAECNSCLTLSARVQTVLLRCCKMSWLLSISRNIFISRYSFRHNSDKSQSVIAKTRSSFSQSCRLQNNGFGKFRSNLQQVIHRLSINKTDDFEVYPNSVLNFCLIQFEVLQWKLLWNNNKAWWKVYRKSNVCSCSIRVRFNEHF